jgi:hypothetical protein
VLQREGASTRAENAEPEADGGRSGSHREIRTAPALRREALLPLYSEAGVGRREQRAAPPPPAPQPPPAPPAGAAAAAVAAAAAGKGNAGG